MTPERLQRAQLLLEAKRPREAAELAAREVAASPSDSDAWTTLSRSYDSMNEPLRALECANRAIGLEPTNADAHLIASRALRALGKSRDAIRAAQETVTLAPMSAGAHANLATVLTSLGDNRNLFGLFLPRHLKRAASHAAQAIALQPAAATGYFAAGFVASHSRRPRQARAYYRQVLAIDPQHAAAINNLAALDVVRGLMAKGGSGYARALAADPNLDVARDNVSGVAHMLALTFHALAWLIYVCFSGIAANQQSGPLTFAWTTRCTVASWLAGAYAVGALAVYLRQDRRVRAFARRMVVTSWIRKTVLLADALTLACFALSIGARGSAAANIYLFGMLGIVIAFIGFILSRPRH